MLQPEQELSRPIYGFLSSSDRVTDRVEHVGDRRSNLASTGVEPLLSFVEERLTTVGCPIPPVGGPLPLVGGTVPLVGQPLPLVGSRLPLVRLPSIEAGTTVHVTSQWSGCGPIRASASPT